MFANRCFAALFKLCQGFLLLAVVLSLLGLPSGVAQATAPNPQPNPPQLLAPADHANLATLTPRLTWSAVPGADHYVVHYYFIPGVEMTAQVTSPSCTLTRTFNQPLEFGIPFFWYVATFMKDASTPNPANSATRRFTLTLQKTPADGAYVTTQTPTFTWSAVSGASYYQLYIAHDLPLDYYNSAPIYSGISLKYSIPASSPLPFNSYYWALCVRLRDGGRMCPLDYLPSTDVQPWSVMVTPALPPAPTLLAPAANAIDNKGWPEFSWQGLDSSVPGWPFKYQIQADTSSSFSHPIVDQANVVPPYVFPDPAVPANPYKFEDNVYYWRVRTINVLGAAGKWGAARKLTVDTTPPPAPVLLNPPDFAVINTGRPTFKWAKVSGASYYQLWVISKNGTAIFKDHFTGTSYTPTASEALAADQYGWSVYAIDAAGYMTSSVDYFDLIVISGTPSGIPATPKLAWPVDNFKTNVAPTFDWTQPDPGLPGEIVVGSDAAFQNVLWEATFNAGDTKQYWNWAKPPLTNGKYYWRVRFYDGATFLSGLWSKARSFSYSTNPPAEPVPIAPAEDTLLTSRRPTFKWSAVPGAVSYTLQFQMNSGPMQMIPLIKKTSYTPSSDLPYGSGTWAISAVDAYGNSTVSSLTPDFQIVLQNSPVPGAILAMSTITFKWAAFPGAASYRLQVNKLSGETPLGSIIDETALPAGSYSAAGLTPGKYQWAVSVNGVVGPSAPSNYFLYIKAGIPAAPKLLSPANGLATNNVAQLIYQWNNVASAATYEIQVSGSPAFATIVQPPFDFTGIAPDPGPITGQPGYPSCPLPTVPLPTTPWPCYWRVRGVNSDGVPGKWSAARSYLYDTSAPDIPSPLFPENEEAVTNSQFSLRWSSVPDAAGYEIRFDTDKNFSNDAHAIHLGKVTSYKLPTTLGQNTYYWTVQAYDAAGNPSDWYSPIQSFTLMAGQSVPKTPTPSATPTPEPSLTPVTGEPTPTDTPTVEPSVEPTIEPSATPAPEEPTVEPTIAPTDAPTDVPAQEPTAVPSTP